MTVCGRGWLWLCALLPFGVAGCANEGVTHNPALFRYPLPFGDIVRTHAKPPGRGYFADFDPDAVTLEVRPLGSPCSPVGTQLVVIATVRDCSGQPSKRRRVEWMLEGAGHLMEVDESGYFAGRGYKVDNRYGVSYTDIREHRISRFTKRPQDDFTVAPGQTWCVVSSATEGETQLTLYAPGVANWDKNRVVVKLRWLDAAWTYPPALTGRSGSEQLLTTSIFRHTDRHPMAGYKVRYRVLDGPPAVLVPSLTRENIATTDLSGFASVGIRQATPALGRNRVLVQIVRPPDPRIPDSVGVVVDEKESVVDWEAPDVTLMPETPVNMTVGTETTYALTLRNNGPVAAQTMTVRTQIPEGMQFVRSDPVAVIDGNQLVWALGELAGKADRRILVTVKPLRVGMLTSRATLLTAEGQRSDKELSTQALAAPVPKLDIKVEGPATALTAPAGGGGTPVPFSCRVTLSNPGTGPATNVVLRAVFTENLRHASGEVPVVLNVGTIAPGMSVPLALPLTPLKVGQADLQVSAVSDNGARGQGSHSLTIEETGLTLTMTGPPMRFANRPAVWELEAANVGRLPLHDVMVRDQLPAEVDFVTTAEGGRLEGREVVWPLGELKPGERKKLLLTTNAARLTPKALNLALATARVGDGPSAVLLSARTEGALTIQGLARLEIRTSPPSAPIGVGGRTSHIIKVVNNGSLAGEQVKLAVAVSPQLKIVSATGPAQGKFDAGRVEFAAVPSLPPQREVVYTVMVEGVKVGRDARLTVEVSSGATGDKPLVKEDSIEVR